MQERMDAAAVAKQGFQATYAFSMAIGEHVDPHLFELIKVRSSMINGCANCVDMHTTAWMEMVEHPRRIVAVSAWREAPYFTERERAVLALTDQVTRLGEDGVTDEVYDEVRAHFDESEYVYLVLAIAVINVWNRVAVSTRKLAAPLDGAVAAPLDGAVAAGV